MKVKVKLSLLASRHEYVWESGGIAPPFLTSALDGGEQSASCPDRERAPGTHWIRGRVGPRASLDTLEKRNISCPCREVTNEERKLLLADAFRLGQAPPAL
jgi:hypothetical protein